MILTLAGVTIATLTGDNGLLQKVQTAKEANDDAKELELIKLAVSAAQATENGILTEKNLNEELKNNFNNEEILSESVKYFIYKTNTGNSYRIYKDGKIEEGKLLPEEYQQVDSIYCDGNQYINIPINDNKNFNNIGTKFKIKITERSNIWGPEIISSEPHGLIQTYIRVGDGDYKDMMGFAANGRALFPNVSYYNDTNKTGIGTITEIDMNSTGDRKLFINNRYVSTFKKEYTEVSQADLFCIFASCYEMDITKLIGYLYDSLCIYNDGVKRIELYPCYRKSDNVVGLYDTANEQFYTNQGNGTFIKGNNV